MTDDAPLRLYDYGASCNCYKVRLLLSQLGWDYDRVPVDIFGGETLTDAYEAVNPARTTPVLELGDGRRLPESAAILMYLAEGTELLPIDAYLRAQVVRWLVYEQTDVIPTLGGLRFRLLTARLRPGDDEARGRRRGGEAALESMDRHLSGRDYFVGDGYTIADLALYGYTHLSHEAGIEMGPYPCLRGWFARVESKPGFIEDVVPYGANAAPGAGKSIYSGTIPETSS